MADATKITSGTLIAAEKVEGTNVYNLQGEKQHPLPWSSLKYDERQGGYVVNLDKAMLEKAPTLDAGSDFTWTSDYGRQVDKYYGAQSYW